ncbi:saccharopine dehydrogenase NADP-binding domain-containing protein [Ornithinimicrobium cavernae]|uniref:saccharopine dehydrogenase NADP-binding domain-containing protein n=1 Tax=Ornithinimicrobium cavernae TaxID=2666047 RepID=UPI0012B178DE|nr:hypothetical protein [Ornithinimicrobium cavernae]
MSKVLLIGPGGVGALLAAEVAALAGVSEVVLAGRSEARLAAARQACLAQVPGARVRGVPLDVSAVDRTAEVLATERPDVLVMCASLRSAWDLLGRSDREATAITQAGLAVRLPYMVSLPLALMRAVREAGITAPVANLCFPDVTGPVLATQGLAPTVGLGNVGMLLLRAAEAAGLDPRRDLIRVVGHHAQMFTAAQGIRPPAGEETPRTYLGDPPRRADDLPYLPAARQPGSDFDRLTVAAATPVIEALLPGAAPLRWSVPAPEGLPGGYPVRLQGASVTMDLPADITLEEAVSLNSGWARGDGVQEIRPDGTVLMTDAAREAVEALDPALGEPLRVEDLPERVALLDHHLHPASAPTGAAARPEGEPC